MNKTKIDYCDSTWNPVTGCLHGCECCYARGIAKRFGGFTELEDTDLDYEKICGSNIVEIGEPLKYINNKGNAVKSPYPFFFKPTLYRYKLNEPQKWKKSRNIFVCSMADLFGKWVPNSWIEEVFKACEKAPQHNYLFLTKNPGRYCDLHRSGILPDKNNMWFGATYDHSNWSNHRIKGRPATFSLESKMVHGAGDYYFPMCPEKRRFVSIEPLLYDIGGKIGSIGADWVIVGAETGKRKNKVTPKREWIEHIVTYCKDNDIPVFIKSSLADIWRKPLIQEFPEGLKTRREVLK